MWRIFLPKLPWSLASVGAEGWVDLASYRAGSRCSLLPKQASCQISLLLRVPPLPKRQILISCLLPVLPGMPFPHKDIVWFSLPHSPFMTRSPVQVCALSRSSLPFPNTYHPEGPLPPDHQTQEARRRGPEPDVSRHQHQCLTGVHVSKCGGGAGLWLS